MKKLGLLMGLVALALLILPVGAAFADNGPHGNFTKVTDACAGCHRAHTAQGKYLLVTDESTLCESCHGSLGTGANTDVLDGVYQNANAPRHSKSANDLSVQGAGLRAGGFDHTIMNTGLSTTAPGSTNTTSVHSIETTETYMWGYGAVNTGPGMQNVSLECTDCHDPHGGSGPNGEPTYRLLRTYPIVAGAPVSPTTSSYVSDETTKTYTVTNAANNAWDPTTKVAFTAPDSYFVRSGGTDLYDINRKYDISTFCAQCHTRHLANTGAYATSSGDAIYTYRHPSGGLLGPTDANKSHGNVNCVTCHVAHGTSSTMTGWAASVSDPGQNGATVEGSAMLRLDNRGVCAQCHVSGFQGPAVLAVSPTSGTAGTVLTIYGKNFGATGTSVTVGGVAATTINSWSTTQITVIVPTIGTTGAKTVVVTNATTTLKNRTSATFTYN